MARRKRGRPRSAGKLKRCPRCGRLGHPVTKTHTKHYKGKTYAWKEDWFSHYSNEMFKAGKKPYCEFCYIPKKKDTKEAIPSSG